MNTKRRLFAAVVTVLMGITVSLAQQIVGVSAEGKTSIYNSLQDAIDKATDGSVIYLPEGSFKITDDDVINHKLCIVGIGHKAISKNADGNTIIAGNLFFKENSSGSSVMGCYISGNVNIGVNDVVVKYSNVNSIQRNNETCSGAIVCENYIRNESYLPKGSLFSNNVAARVYCECGRIVNNLILGGSFNASYVAKNIFLSNTSVDANSSFANMAKGNVGSSPINIGDKEWTDLFVKYNNGAVTPASDFHFVDDYKTLYKDYGIYGGSGFNPSGQPPLPFFAAKRIPEQTDATGNLTIQIRVNSGEQNNQ